MRAFKWSTVALVATWTSVVVSGIQAKVHATQPHLSGIFVAITTATSHWTEEQWTKDLTSMQQVGMTFAVLPHLAKQNTTTQADSQCPLGYYNTLFNATTLGPCFSQTGTTENGGTVETILKAASSVGMTLQLGLATNGEIVTHDPGCNAMANCAKTVSHCNRDEPFTQRHWVLHRDRRVQCSLVVRIVECLVVALFRPCFEKDQIITS